MAHLDVSHCNSAVDQEKAQRFDRRFGDVYTQIRASSYSKTGFWISAFNPECGWQIFDNPYWWQDMHPREGRGE